ncbi:hypothetical protein DFP73DRAFT_562115 [Morchella snyderi]|nr:hypothetical protein DFP73DRAFT_562115 [Morchella snyderi]
MASVSDPDPDADAEASTYPRRGPIIVSSDSDSDSEPERPPRHLRAPSKTPSWAKSVSRSPTPIARMRGKAKRSVSPGIGRWGGGDEQGYESAESGRIRLRKERSPSVLREEESGDEDVPSSGSEVEVSSDESGVEDSEDEVGSDGGLEAASVIEEQLHQDGANRASQTRVERQESTDQELQSEAASDEDEESEDEKEAPSSGPEDNADTEPEEEAESEMDAKPELEIESEEEEAEWEVEAKPEVEVESEAEAESEAEVESEVTEAESEADVKSEAEAESEVEDMSVPLNEPEDSSESGSESEGGPGPESELEPEDEAQFADESQLETQPLYELPPSIHSYANSATNSGPATPSPSSDDSDAEEEEEEEESPVPFASPKKRPAASLDSPSPSDHSVAGDKEDTESRYTDSGEDESEDEFAGIEATATTPSASKGRPKRAAALRAAEQQAAAQRATKRRAAARRAPKVTGRKRGRQVDVYNPKYIELLNDQIELAASRGLSEIKHDREHVTPVLGSVWTRRERDMFFKYIAIVGKDNVAELARLIGTKSVVECRAYVKALQDGREHDWHAPAKRWIREREIFSTRDVPAAVELSDECVEALEEEADALEVRIRKDEERREKVKWGDLWRLDTASSWTIEQMYKGNEIDEIRDIAPETELLNIYNMLEISESIFMNGSGDGHNWQFLGSDSPAIRYTAFKDLHTLVVSLTRRIVQTTIYMATSRVRGMESQVFGKSKLIRPADVKAAVNCLRLPENSREYWIRIPRRTGLHVYNRKEDIRKKSNMGYIPYDELEQVLKSTRTYGSGSGVNPGGDGDEEDDEAVEAKMDALLAAAYVERDNNEGTKHEDASDIMDTEVSDLDPETGIDSDEDDDDENHESADSDMDIDGTLRSKPQKKLDSSLEAMDNAEDAYMEAMDMKRSYKEEKALWELMGTGPSQPLPEISKSLPGLPPLGRKRPLDLMNWRDSAGYLAPWETDKRRKANHDGGLWRGDDDSSTAFHSTATLSESQTTTKVHKHKVIPKRKRRPTAKKQKQAKVLSPMKAISPPAHKPRRTRERRQSKVYSGFVSTVDNIIESDEEALALELQEDNSLSEGNAD